MSAELRVLYADDNQADADLTTAHFARHAPECAIDVVDTASACLARLSTIHYDVLLLDNRLPDMDGIEVLKALTATGLMLPIVMVTAVGDESLVVQALRLGAADYVPKHGTYLERLPAVLKEAAADARRRAVKEHAARQQPRRVLYVERHSADIDLTLKRFAEVAPHLRVEIVQSSEHALARLQEEAFDLVLADLRIADMNALDLFNEAKHEGCLVPFMIITGQGDEDAAVAALKLGVADYIVKRDNYLTQLPYAIDNAIARAQLADLNRRLQSELTQREALAAENARLFTGAQDAIRARDEFLSIAAHEIRGPLTALRLAIQTLQKGKMPASAQAGLFDIIDREDRKLAQFVDELLDLGRIRSGTLHFAFEPVDLGDVAREVTSRFGGELARSGSSLSVTTEGRLVGEWDRSRLDQIVTNLYSNAIKFGLGRPIEVLMRGEGDKVTLVVKDRGAGIPGDMQERIFQPFEREMSHRNYGGLGLGLYIVRTIVEGLGGSLTVESQPGAGSTFTVELPRHRDS
jgi:signal transduction histidine kinase